MGIIAQGKSLWNALFTRTQRQVLSLMYGHPERSYYANEVVRIAGVGTGSVQRELARLSECGLLTVRRIGNQKHFQANPDSPLYPEIRSIVIKTFGAIDLLRSALNGLNADIQLALIYGSALHSVKGGSQDINLLLIADGLDHADLVSGLAEVEKRIGRRIHPLLMNADEYASKLASDDEAVLFILGQPRLVLTGSLV